MAVLVASGAFPGPPASQDLLLVGATDRLLVGPGVRLVVNPGSQPGKHARILWRNEAVSASATTEAFGADAGNAITADTSQYWQPTSYGAELTIDLGQRRRVNCVGIGAHNICTSGAQVQIETEQTVGATPVVRATSSQTDDGAIMAFFPAATVRLVRLWIIGPPVRIGHVSAGMTLDLPAPGYADHAPLTWGNTVTTRGLQSTQGWALDWVIEAQGLSGKYGFSHIPEAWIVEHLLPVKRAMQRGPFFIAGRPEADPWDCALAWLSGDLVPQRMGLSDLCRFDLNLQGQAND